MSEAELLLSGRKSARFTAMDMKDPPIDFVSVAKGMGLSARSVTDPADIHVALMEALSSGSPSLIEVIVQDGFGNVNGKA